MIYRLLRLIVKMALFFFFRRITVTGKEHIPLKGPLIIVANHPNTMMDPLLIASITKKRMGFIANAGIFVNKTISSILNFLHVIPIYRKKDVKPGEKPNNENTFVKCHEYLEKGGTFIIFPEGNSYYELKLRDLKTGTARIALSYEALKNFNGNLKILPVALDYSDAIQFRTVVAITVHPPIEIANFKDAYNEDNFEGVKKLTEAIRKELVKNIPHTSDKSQENFLIKMHTFYTAYGLPNEDFDVQEVSKDTLFWRNQVSKAMNYLDKKNPELYESTQHSVFSFFDKLNEEKLTTGFFTDGFSRKNSALLILAYTLQFIVLLPMYIIGLTINYLPYILPASIFRALKIDIEYKTSVQMIAGLITFPLFYFLELWLIDYFLDIEIWQAVLLVVLFLISGYLAMFYYTQIKRFKRIIHYYFYMSSEKKREVIQLRNQILNHLEVARTYLDVIE